LLANFGSGTLTINPGSGGPRRITGDLTNTGSLIINTDTTFDKTDGVYRTFGTITVAAGKTLSLSGGADQSFTQEDGTLEIKGAFAMSAGTFSLEGGGVATSGSFSLSGGTFNFLRGGIGTALLTNSALRNGAGSERGGYFIFHGGGNTLSGDITAAQLILVEGSDAGGHAKLTAVDSFTNAGLIMLRSTNQGWASDLGMTNGATLTNNGRIYIDPGSGGPRWITGNLTNVGDLVISTDTTFDSTTGAYVNAGVLVTNATVRLSGGIAQSFSQNGGSLGVVGTFTMSSGTFTLNGGTVNNSGGFSLSGAPSSSTAGQAARISC
jgi:filamentous hemagglutinin